MSEQEIVVIEPGNGTTCTQFGGSVKKFNSGFQRHIVQTYNEFNLKNGKDLGTPITVDLGTRGLWDIGLDGLGAERLMGVNRYVDPVWSDLVVSAALSKHSQLLRGGPATIRLGVSCPYAYLKGVGTGGLDVKQAMIKAMKGTHNVPYGKKTVPIKVSTVQVWGEGLIGFAYMALDKDKVLKPEYKGTNTLLLDVGLDTMNTGLFIGSQPHIDTVQSPAWGLGDLYKKIARRLDHTKGRVFLHDVETLILSGEGTAEQKAIIKEEIEKYLDRFIRFIPIVEGHVHETVDRVMVIGGIVKVIPQVKEIIKAQREKSVFGDEFTNVRGLNLLLGGVDAWDTSDV